MPFEFPQTVETLDTVPAEFKGLYVKADDGAAGFIAHPDFKGHIHGLVSALESERKGRKTEGTQLAAWKKLGLGDTPESAAEAIEVAKKAGPKTNETQAQFDERLAKMKLEFDQTLGAKVKEKDDEILSMRGSLESYLVDAEATAALTGLECLSPMLGMPFIKANVKVLNENGKWIARVVDKDGDPRGDGKGGYMTIKDLVAEMKKKPEFAPIFKASGNKGSGMRPNSQGETPNSEKLTPVQKIEQGLAARS